MPWAACHGCCSCCWHSCPLEQLRHPLLACSACRAVWYCGTACSHADWREGGHRRVCKALAAERQARRQVATAAAAGEQAEEEQQEQGGQVA